MENRLNPTTGDYSGQRTQSLENPIYIRLMTPLGQYWADASLGSRLHELKREKDLSRISKLACQYSEQALAPLIKDGRAKSIEVTADQPHNGTLLLYVTVEDAQGQTQYFKQPVKVV